MLNATIFTYDNVRCDSTDYELVVATINGSTLENATYVSPEVLTAKPSYARKSHFQGVRFSEAPTTQFSIIDKDGKEIGSERQARILAWLDEQKGFRKLEFPEGEPLYGYFYNCILSITEVIYFAGSCIGFNVTATFDSPYMYKNPTTYSASGSCTLEILNSSTLFEYVYPTVVFTITGYLYKKCEEGTPGALKVVANDATPESGEIKEQTTGLDDINVGDYVVPCNNNIEIINTTDDLTREFIFSDIPHNTEITIDNELKVITSEGSSSNLLQNFNKNWLRLRAGSNTLSVKIAGTVDVICPHYEKIRF